MKQNKVALKTMAIKARIANYTRKTFYKKRWENLKEVEKEQILKEIFDLNHKMHYELKSFKLKRQAKAELYQKRLKAPQTKSMRKKLGLIPKTPKINLAISK